MCRRWISAPVSCQATAGATSVERSCSRGLDESVLSIPRLRSSGGAGPVAGGPRGVLCNDIAPHSCIILVYKNLDGKGLRGMHCMLYGAGKAANRSASGTFRCVLSSIGAVEKGAYNHAHGCKAEPEGQKGFVWGDGIVQAHPLPSPDCRIEPELIVVVRDPAARDLPDSCA